MNPMPRTCCRLSGRWIVAAASVLGASLGGLPVAAQRAAPVTFTKDVAPIVFEHCATCHRPGELAPFSLLTYEEVKQHARQIATVTTSRFMPPWRPDPAEVPFVGERRLTDAQIQVIQQWVEQGAAEGNARDLPPAPVFESTWHLGTPDLVVTMPEPFDVPADGKDVFRNIVLHVPLTTQRFVQAVEFRPGNARVIHHARILVDETDASRWRDLDDPGPGFGGMEAPEAHFPDGHFLGWAPGKLATKESLPWPMAVGTDLVIQLHMRPTGKPERVQSSVGLYFTDKPPAAAPVMLRLGSRTLDIPAGTANYTVSDSYALPTDVVALRIYPHAHYLAKDISVVATLPAGGTKNLIHITNWDFNWQDEYTYTQPVSLPRGTTLSMKYVYDNSAGNPHNPHTPPVRVRFGPEATDEMCEVLVQLVPSDPGTWNALRNDVNRKVLTGDIAGYEMKVAENPNDYLMHNALGAAYFQIGRTDDALAQLNKSVELNADHAVTHFNLSVIAMVQGRLDAAAASLRRAIALRPDYTEAHNNLGIVLMRQGALDQAIGQFRDVLRIHADSSNAHYNLARALLSAGQTAEAIDHFRQAIVTKPDVPSMLDDLAWILSTSPDEAVRNPKEAVGLAEHAADLTGHRNPSVLDTLGAAYAANSQWDQAVQAAHDAFDLASAANAPDLAADFLKRLDLYRRKEPYREAVVK